jgi:ABC-2 type transport system permease protein
MMPGVFWKLLRHEVRLKGSWRRQSRPHLSGRWLSLYFLLLLFGVLGTMGYYAFHQQLQLQNLWFIWFGIPYMLVAFGASILKREWDNDTFGWWLTLPYPRLWLVSAKWIAAWLRVMAVLAGIFVLLSIYALILSLSLSPYMLAEVGDFMLTGLYWFFLITGFSPFILAVSLLIGSVQFCSLRPLSPILWAGFAILISYAYGGLRDIFPDGTRTNLVRQAAGSPFTWEVLTVMAVSWIAAYLIIRLVAYLLEHKLNV